MNALTLAFSALCLCGDEGSSYRVSESSLVADNSTFAYELGDKPLRSLNGGFIRSHIFQHAEKGFKLIFVHRVN